MSSSPQKADHSDKDNVIETLGKGEQTNNLEELPSVCETETSPCSEILVNNNNDLDELPNESYENHGNCNTSDTSKTELNGLLNTESNNSIKETNCKDVISNTQQFSDSIGVNITSQSNEIKHTETTESNSRIDDKTKIDVDSCNSVESSWSNSGCTEEHKINEEDHVKSKYTRGDFISQSSDPEIEDEEENSSQTSKDKPVNTQTSNDDVYVNIDKSDSDKEKEDENLATVNEAMGQKSSKDVRKREWFGLFIHQATNSFSLLWFVLWAGVSIFLSVVYSFFPILEPQKKTKEKKNFSLFSPRRWSDRDTEVYRQGYPDKKDNKHDDDNVQFYKNQIRSKPDGDYIDEIHKHWTGDHVKLEQHHGFIQWLFPIRESGMNWYAQELQLHEAQAIQDDPKAYNRVLKSYEMMLDFYGMRLVNEETGELGKAKGEKWKERFHNLNRSMHNYLRITRILKSLGELGYEHFKAPFIDFIIDQVLNGDLSKRILDSCTNYWVGTVKDDDTRERLMKKALETWDEIN